MSRKTLAISLSYTYTRQASLVYNDPYIQRNPTNILVAETKGFLIQGAIGHSGKIL